MPLKPNPDEDLLHFARRNEVSSRDVLSHPDNAGLFGGRHAGALHEDDEIEVPEQPEPREVESGKSHVLVYAPQERVLMAMLHDHDGYPLSADFAVKDIDYGDHAKGDEPAEVHGYAHLGAVEVRLPAYAKKATLVVDDDPSITLTLELGRADPISTRSGVLARLHALGFYQGAFDEFSVGGIHALQHFQHEQGLPVTGQPDAATRGKLAALCGDPPHTYPTA